MERVHRRVLEAVVERYDGCEQPVTAAEISVICAIGEDSVRTCFDKLQRNHLIKPVDDDGFRPTVTARELLDLNLDYDELLVLDTDPEEDS